MATKPSSIGDARDTFQESLSQVRKSSDLHYFKLGTEEEGLDFNEIEFIREALPRDVAIYVKIGGPCARGDLRQAASVGAAGIVAPMVESVYALWHFIEAATKAFAQAPGRVQLGINIETKTAVAVLPDMLAHAAAKRLDFTNIGRSDLAGSLGCQVDQPSMHDVVCAVVEQVHAAGIPIQVGGQVTLRTLAPILARTRIDGFHTRFLGFGPPDPATLPAEVDGALGLEMALLRLLAARFPARAAEHLARAHVTATRRA